MSGKKINCQTVLAADALNKGSNKYDAWLQWKVGLKCNLSCAYCCNLRFQSAKISQYNFLNLVKTINSKMRRLLEIPRLGFFGLVEMFKFRFNKIFLRNNLEKFNIRAVIRTLDKTNKTFRIGFTGGEPFLISNFIQLCAELTKKHYIAINTNLTTDRMVEFCEKIGPARVIGIYSSVHIKELERLNLLDRYISNFLICKEKGFNIIAQEVGYPPLLNEVEQYKRFFRKKEIDLVFQPFIGKHAGKDYPGAYTEQEKKIFDFDMMDMGDFYQKGKLCNAGYNVGVVFLDGTVRTCFDDQEILGNIYSKIKLKNRVGTCPSDFCSCHLKSQDPYLFEEAISKYERLDSFLRQG